MTLSWLWFLYRLFGIRLACLSWLNAGICILTYSFLSQTSINILQMYAGKIVRPTFTQKRFNILQIDYSDYHK